jgi:hypothetical protein
MGLRERMGKAIIVWGAQLGHKRTGKVFGSIDDVKEHPKNRD